MIETKTHFKVETIKTEKQESSRDSSPEIKQVATPPRKRKPRLPKRSRKVEDELDLTVFKDGYNNLEYEKHISSDMRQDLAVLNHVFKHSRKLVIVTGAGISVAAGIPDFRSTTGLFTTLRNDLKLKSTGKSMFDASVYKDPDSTQDFHTTVQNLHKLCSEAKPTNFHHFVDSIAAEGRLTRLYTQNIDALDSDLPNLGTNTPLTAPWPKTVQLHGTLFKMVCSKCGWLNELKPEIFRDGDTPECPECAEIESVRAIAGKRLQGIGKLRPRLVLYNESNPDAEAIGKISESDLLSKPDGLVVAGTSMKIPGVKRIVREMSSAVHAAKGAVVWMNKESPQLGKEFEGCFDLVVKGDCQIVPELLDDYNNELRSNELKREEAKRARQQKNNNVKKGNKVISDTFKVQKNFKQQQKTVNVS